MYTGIIIRESLSDPSIIDRFTILGGEVCKDPNNPGEYWHLFTVDVSEDEVETIAAQLKPTGFYAHFGNATLGLVAFPNKVFKLDPHDPGSWSAAISYGRSISIPDAQLDFSFEDL